MTSELLHDGLHRLLILFEQGVELPVLVKERVVFYDDLRVLAL